MVGVRGLAIRTARRCRGPVMNIWSVASARTVRTQRSAKAFALGLLGGIFTTSIPVLDSAMSNAVRAGNLVHIMRPGDTR
jgi:hypothetical protein